MPTTKKLYETFLKYPKISTDTRKDVAGSIFFALSGEQFNGNKFASDALKKGARLAVIDNKNYLNGDDYFLVKDVLKTLQELATIHRENFSNPVIAITGSNGKTTTKELIAAVLGSSKKIVSTEGNLNNHIGVPLTLLRIERSTEIAVIEMGANHQGEIKQLCNMAKPNVGLITNIGKAHLEGFGSFEGVIKAKNELYESIANSKGKLIVYADDPLLMRLSSRVNRFTYGSVNADINGELLSLKPGLKLLWKYENISHELSTNLYGKYNFQNVMAAIATGIFFGVEPEKINRAIGAYTPRNNRSQLLKTASNNIILDAYNANPVSMTEAIRSFHESGFENAWLILGDMFELGKDSLSEHQNIVSSLSRLKMKNVILVGKDFYSIKIPENFVKFETTGQAAEYLNSNPISQANILVKGSRGMKLETLLSYL